MVCYDNDTSPHLITNPSIHTSIHPYKSYHIKYKLLIIVGTRELVLSKSETNLKLPQIKFNRKAARSVPRIDKKAEDEVEGASNKVQQRLIALQDSIQNYREEYDYLMQKKALVGNDLKIVLNGFFSTLMQIVFKLTSSTSPS